MEIRKFKRVAVHHYDGEKITEATMDIPQPTMRTHYTSRYFPKNYEVNNQPSMTIPDEAMTVMEIMQRYASGLPLHGGKIGYYEGEDGMSSDDLKKLDLAERQQIIE